MVTSTCTVIFERFVTSALKRTVVVQTKHTAHGFTKKGHAWALRRRKGGEEAKLYFTYRFAFYTIDMLRKTLLRRQHVHPEAGRYSQATFHDGAHRQAPGDSTPWRDTTNPLLKLRTWWMAPAAKGSIIAAWSCSIVVFSYCWSLQIDAKGTYAMNNILLRNLHQEAVRADAAEERAKSMQLLLAEAQAAAAEANKLAGPNAALGKKSGGSGGGLLGLFGSKKDASTSSGPSTPAAVESDTASEGKEVKEGARTVLDSTNSMVNYELELTRERVRSAEVHARNQQLVEELGKLRTEVYALQKDKRELGELNESLRARIM